MAWLSGLIGFDDLSSGVVLDLQLCTLSASTAGLNPGHSHNLKSAFVKLPVCSRQGAKQQTESGAEGAATGFGASQRGE